MFWIALRPRLPPVPSATAWPDSLSRPETLAWQALRFSPRVAQVEEAVLLEAQGSLRLWGGKRRLFEQLQQLDSEEQPLTLSSAPTGLAALALARHVAGLLAADDDPPAPQASCMPEVRRHLHAGNLQAGLDALPLQSLSAVARHAPTLERLGCRNLGAVRALPRGGLNRRFDAALLDALDQAYGLKPEVYPWISPPETFAQRIELPFHTDSADRLLFAAGRMLQALQAWLAARHSGIRSFDLSWLYEHHQQDEDPGEGLTIASAQTGRDLCHWLRLLAEHLARQPLRAPVCELRLRVLQTEPLPPQNSSLLPDSRHNCSALLQFLERASARFGAAQVVSPQPRSEHRVQQQTLWRDAVQMQAGRQRATQPALAVGAGRGRKPMPGSSPPSPQVSDPLPCWLLEPVLPLPMNAQSQPLYQGPLKLLAGPQRIEAGWWDTGLQERPAGLTLRDYFLAESEHAGLLWIYRERRPVRGAAQWFLHGIYG